MAKKLSKKRQKELEELSLHVGEEMMNAMTGHKISLLEALTVISMAVSCIIHASCQLNNENEDDMIECFCESLKVK